MNEAGREGWEYLRTDTLPMESRAGWFMGRTVAPQELLVFRRALAGGEAALHGAEAREVPAPTPAFARSGRAPGGRNGAVTSLPQRPAAPVPHGPVEPPVSVEAARDGWFSDPPAPEPRGPGHGAGPPRLGGARRD